MRLFSMPLLIKLVYAPRSRRLSPSAIPTVLVKFLCSGLFLVATIHAQNSGAPPPVQAPVQPPSQNVAPPPQVPAPVLVINKAFCGEVTAQVPCRINGVLSVSFDQNNLKQWMGKNKVSDLTLVLNGRVMDGLMAHGPDSSYNTLQFDLKVWSSSSSGHADNRQAWNALIPELRQGADFGKLVMVHVAVADAGKPPYIGSVDTKFQVTPWWAWGIVVLLAGFLAGFIVLARNSDIVRDAPSVGGIRRSFSLARCQMAWWFFIVVASYCYIWMLLGDHDSLTTGALVLIGMSIATGLSATVIDGSKNIQRNQLVESQATLSGKISSLQTAIAAAPTGGATALQAELEAATTQFSQNKVQLAALPSPTGPSVNFLMDILSDETGISFHRFQMLGWTVVLGLVFTIAVYTQFVMPDFSTTLLGLMGISSGTYIGFKIADSPK